MIRLLVLSLLAGAVAVPTAGSTGMTSSASCRGAISWTAARQAVGRIATVKGPVVDAYYARSSNGSPTFLNVGRAYPSPSRFTIVIWSENRARFGTPERRYRGRTICVRGRVSTYQGAPQMEAVSPSQIAVAG
jgi:hypothetical protein